ncbi:DUF72 domain-containing protein [Elusimicrobiota bacterium]
MIRVGTSGFSFKDWTPAIYPENLKKEDYLNYYRNELGFDSVELNVTYYTLLSLRSLQSMINKTDPGFEFTVKAYKGITHDPFDYRIANRPNKNKIKEFCEVFSDSIRYLNQNSRYSIAIFQFPVFFYPSPENYDYILQIKENFSDIPMAIEFRNRKWIKEKTFAFLKDNSIAYCIVDEPKLDRLVPFCPRNTANIAYIRLHGRNKKWFNSPSSIRYDYLYTRSELLELLPGIKKVAESAGKTYIFFNNCHGGNAVTNAHMIKDMLGL